MSWDNQKIEAIEKEPKESKIEFKSLKDAKENRGIKILSYGNFSTGKTHFALTSDAPIFVIDTENGTGPLADKFPNAQVINICESIGEDTDEKDEVKNFENFQEAIKFLIALPDEQIGTIVIDSITDIWSWCQAYAKVKIFKLNIEDRLKQRFDWGIINTLLRKQILKLINKNCNLIFTAREADIWDDASGPSGRVRPEVQKKVPFFVDIVLRHEYRFINKQILFQVKVEKCRYDGNKIGQVIENPTFAKIQEMIKCPKV